MSGYVFSRSLGFFSACVLLAAMGCQQKNGASQGADRPPAQVTVVTIQPQTVHLTSELPGRAVAMRKAEVRPQISGIVQRRLFSEGARVEAGEQLYQIDDSRYKAAVSTAKANVTSAEANLTSARSRHKRIKNLLAEKAISQQQYDDALATLQQAEAELQSSQANLQTAQIDLNYTRVTAPIKGRIGKSAVTEGALVSAQQAATMATILQLDPIYVDLAQSAKDVMNIRRQIAAGKLSMDEGASVTLTLETGEVYEHKGELQFADMSVNESTGTVVMRALFPNPQHFLLPGMFVRAQVQEGVQQNALLVPQRGVTRDREGNATSMVVTADNTVEPRKIIVQRAVGSDWLVESGLNAGDRVIVEGLQKIAAGAPVQATELSSQSDSAAATKTPSEEQ